MTEEQIPKHKAKWEERAEKEILADKVFHRLYSEFWTTGIVCNFWELDYQENPINLTSAEIIYKIREFLRNEPTELQQSFFLNFLAKYPISICQRNVTQLLKHVIGFIYHYSETEFNEEQKQNGAEKISYDDLAKIFCRSKAIIHDCVVGTEADWQEVLRKVEEEKALELEARKQLIEDKKKELLRAEEQKQTNNQAK